MQSVQILSNLNYPIGRIINQELEHSIDTKISVAFLKQTGVKYIEASLLKSLENGGAFEIIAGLDFKTTDPKAMLYFINLSKENKNVHIYCYGDRDENKTDIVFHPKIYLFKNRKETSAIIGSSNMTAGGLESNFEVNSVFIEDKPVVYLQAESIYNFIKYTDSLFIPNEEYVYKYADVYKAFEKNGESAKKDKGIQKIIAEINSNEKELPGTIPSINSMIIDLMKSKLNEGIQTVKLTEIYEYLEKRIEDPIFSGKYKLDTFRNTIRGELNHNEISVDDAHSKKLYKREEKGIYSLTDFGKDFKGR